MSDQRSVIITNPKADEMHTVKRWIRIPDCTRVRFREEGREGIIDGLTELVVGRGRNPNSRRSIVSMPEVPIGHLRLRTICWS